MTSRLNPVALFPVLMVLIATLWSYPVLFSIAVGNKAAGMSLKQANDPAISNAFSRARNNASGVIFDIMEGRWLLRNGRLNESVERLRRSVETAPGNHAAQFFLGLALAENGQTDEAVVHLRQAGPGIEGFQTFDILTHYAWLKLKAKEWETAENYYKTSLALTPRTWSKWLNLAQFYRDWRGDYEEGVATLLKAQEEIPGKIEPNLELASFYRSKDRYRLALKEVKKAFDKAPHSSEVFDSAYHILKDRPELGLDEWLRLASSNLSREDPSLTQLEILRDPEVRNNRGQN